MLQRLSGLLSMLLALGLGLLIASVGRTSPNAALPLHALHTTASTPNAIQALLARLNRGQNPAEPGRAADKKPRATPPTTEKSGRRRRANLPLATVSHDVGRFATAPFPVPAPQLAVRPLSLPTRDARHGMPLALTKLVALPTAPFPYDGNIPGHGTFLDMEEDGRYGHTTARGHVLWADETFSDDRTLLHIPKGFDIRRKSVLLLFLHGHGATLIRDVWHRQKLPQQVDASGRNVVLVAPQFAVNAADSSIGKFWQTGGLRRFLSDTAHELATLYGRPDLSRKFARMPVVIVAYSGGFVSAAWAIKNGRLGSRLKGIVLLDALYGYRSVFEEWSRQNDDVFLANIYGTSTERRSKALEAALESAGRPFEVAMPGRLAGGTIVSINAPSRHRDYVTMASNPYPVADLLRRMAIVDPVLTRHRLATRSGWQPVSISPAIQ